MMYSEFVANVKCRDNDHNFKVFKNLEELYMMSDVTKEEIYKMGRKLVNNSKTTEELEIEKEMKEKIEECNDSISWYESRIESLNLLLAHETDKAWIKYWKKEIKKLKEQIKREKIEIQNCKFVLNA